jgi:hypothetical protein
MSHLAIERLDVAILSGTAPLNEQGPHLQPVQPAAQRLGNELGAVIRTQVDRHSPFTEQLHHGLLHVFMIELPLHSHRQALSRVLIDHIQDPKRPAILRPLQHKIVTPDMSGDLGLLASEKTHH